VTDYHPHNIHESDDVLEFQIQMGHYHTIGVSHLTKRKLLERLACMQEELDEFKAAVEAQDLPEQVDALIDLVYFAKGTANMLGVTGNLWHGCWSLVHEANMRKVPGQTKRGILEDAAKPEGWMAPDVGFKLRQFGYVKSFFTDQNGNVLEELCHDGR